MASDNLGIRDMTWADVLGGDGNPAVQNIFTQPFGGEEGAAPVIPGDVPGWMGVTDPNVMNPQYTAPDIFSSPNLFPGGFTGFTGIGPAGIGAGNEDGTENIVYDPATETFQPILNTLYGSQAGDITNALADPLISDAGVNAGSIGGTPFASLNPQRADWTDSVTSPTGAQLGEFKDLYAAGTEQGQTMTDLGAAVGMEEGMTGDWTDKGFDPRWNLGNIYGGTGLQALPAGMQNQSYIAALANAAGQGTPGTAPTADWSPSFGTGTTIPDNLAIASPTSGVGLDNALFTGTGPQATAEERISAKFPGTMIAGAVAPGVDRSSQLAQLYGSAEGDSGIIEGLGTAGYTPLGTDKFANPYIDTATAKEMAANYRIPTGAGYGNLAGGMLIPENPLSMEKADASPWLTHFPGKKYALHNAISGLEGVEEIGDPLMTNLGDVAAGGNPTMVAGSEEDANILLGASAAGISDDMLRPAEVAKMTASASPNVFNTPSNMRYTPSTFGSGLTENLIAHAKTGPQGPVSYADFRGGELDTVGEGFQEALAGDYGPIAQKEDVINPIQETAYSDILGSWTGPGGLQSREGSARADLLSDEATALQAFNAYRSGIMGDPTLPTTSRGFAPAQQADAWAEYIKQRDTYDTDREAELNNYMADITDELGAGGAYEGTSNTGRGGIVSDYGRAMGLPGSGGTAGYLPKYKETMKDAWNDYIADRSAAVLGFGTEFGDIRSTYDTDIEKERQAFLSDEISQGQTRQDKIGAAKEEYRDTERDIDREIRSLDREATAARRAIRGFEGGGLVSGRRGRMGDEEYEQIQQQKQDLETEKKEAKRERAGAIKGARKQYGRDMDRKISESYQALVGAGGVQQVAQEDLAREAQLTEDLLAAEGTGYGEVYDTAAEGAETALSEGRAAALAKAQTDEGALQTQVEKRILADQSDAEKAIGADKDEALTNLYGETGEIPSLKDALLAKEEAVHGEGSTITADAKSTLDPVATARETYLGKDKTTGVGLGLKGLGDTMQTAWKDSLKGLEEGYDPDKGYYPELFAQEGLGIGRTSSGIPTSPIFGALGQQRGLYAGSVLDRYGDQDHMNVSNIAPSWIGFGSDKQTASNLFSSFADRPKFMGGEYVPTQIRPHWGSAGSAKADKAMGWKRWDSNAGWYKPTTKGLKIGGWDGRYKVFPTFKANKSQVGKFQDMVAHSPSAGGAGFSTGGAWKINDQEGWDKQWEGLEYEGREQNLWK